MFEEETPTLALEMMHELKKTSKRWFIMSIIFLIAFILSNICWLIYESQFTTVVEDSTQQTYYTDESSITQNIE